MKSTTRQVKPEKVRTCLTARIFTREKFLPEYSAFSKGREGGLGQSVQGWRGQSVRPVGSPTRPACAPATSLFYATNTVSALANSKSRSNHAAFCDTTANDLVSSRLSLSPFVVPRNQGHYSISDQFAAIRSVKLSSTVTPMAPSPLPAYTALHACSINGHGGRASSEFLRSYAKKPPYLSIARSLCDLNNTLELEDVDSWVTYRPAMMNKNLSIRRRKKAT